MRSAEKRDRALPGQARRALVGTAALFALAAMAVGCGAGAARGPTVTPDGRKIMDTRVLHEACDIQGKGVEQLGAANGKHTIFVVRASGREVCQGIDFGRDGKIDLWVYYDAQGRERRREADYDQDGRIDEILLMSAGVIQERHQASNLRGMLDTWHYYTAGKLARTERDSDGDTVIDQWWEYPKGAECPIIHSDVDGDGRPDPGASVDYCKETGYVPPERNEDRAKTTSPDFSTPSGTPVETDNRETDEGRQEHKP